MIHLHFRDKMYLDQLDGIAYIKILIIHYLSMIRNICDPSKLSI
jgi:hypothetical protein